MVRGSPVATAGIYRPQLGCWTSRWYHQVSQSESTDQNSFTDVPSAWAPRHVCSRFGFGAGSDAVHTPHRSPEMAAVACSRIKQAQASAGTLTAPWLLQALTPLSPLAKCSTPRFICDNSGISFQTRRTFVPVCGMPTRLLIHITNCLHAPC